MKDLVKTNWGIDLPRDMREKYLNKRISEIVQLRMALERGELSFLDKVGHQIKGNAETFQFHELAPLGSQIEIAAKQGDVEALKRVIHLLEAALKFYAKNF